MRIKINEVSVEWNGVGAKKYGAAVVSYSYNGEPRTQKIVSFANPSIFKEVQELQGQEVEVELTKNAKGYTEWASIKRLGDSESTGANSGKQATNPGTGTARATGSTYETKEERAVKQVYIVKQSSIANAIALLKTEKNTPPTEEVLKTAQNFVDFVFGNDSEESADVPY